MSTLVAACNDDGACSCASSNSLSVHQALSCRCNGDAASAHCPANMAAFVASVCAQSMSSMAPVVHETGCGKVSFSSGGGYAGGNLIFDQGSGALIGIYDYSDTRFGSCMKGIYLYGEGLFPPGTAVIGAEGCDDITSCTVCGQSTMAPPCP